MGRTGHRSINGICIYKWVSNEQKEDISNVLNSATNGDIQPQLKKLKVTHKVTRKTHATAIQSQYHLKVDLPS